MSGRLLGIDLGERRIGLAIADGAGGRTRPLATIHRARTVGEDARAIGLIVEELGVAELIVGLPLEASGNEGPMAAAARLWASEVSRALGVPAAMRDERLTSHLAETRLGPMKRGRSGGAPSAAQRAAYHARVDREAAAIILQDELDARAALGAGGGRAR